MRCRLHARSVLALALLSAACSGPAGGGGEPAASGATTSSTIAFGSLHDTVPPDPDAPVPPTGAASPGSSSPRPTSGVTGKGGITPTTATTTSQRGTSPTTATTASPPPGLPPEKCPEPKTCRRYGFYTDTPARWPADPDGVVRIPYLINPSGSTTLTPEQIEGAIRAAFDTWERAAPTIRFVYLGRTDRPAATGDGMNVIGFNGATIEATAIRGDKYRNVIEFDMLYTPNTWTWAPCAQADNSCTPHSLRTATGGVPRDLQSIATHAAGHALWLGDMEDESLDKHLTMSPTLGPAGDRQKSTLALGDVLGVRALYPCSCPLPPIYDP